MARVRFHARFTSGRAHSFLGALAVLALLANAPGIAAGAAHAEAGTIRDVSGSPAGHRLAVAAHRRLAAHGFRVPLRELGVWHDAAGILVAPRGNRLADQDPKPGARQRGRALVPVAAPEARTARSRSVAAVDDQTLGWSLVYSQCYERISDTWSWLDHCARIYRLAGDGDPAHDYYGLQRVATFGANVPWVVKSASISAMPLDASLMTWTDWSPRSDRSGPCQPTVVGVTVPIGGLYLAVDRCETWDITKGARGGDFRLDWYGCACTHDRALAFDLTVSVPQGRAPGWYVPADVHGFAF